MSSTTPTLVLIPGAWHKPTCYDKITNLLRERHVIRCVYMTLPSTNGDRNATFKDDLDAAREVVMTETSQGRDIIVVAHSYGGIVGSSVIRGFTRPNVVRPNTPSAANPESSGTGYVRALVLIASGFAITGVSFMDPLFGIPPPSWRVNKESGFAEIVATPSELFYHDLTADEAQHWVSQLTPQSLKALFEGGEHVYGGWRDIPTWYIGTIEDKGLPVLLQRVQVGMARGQGGAVHHKELQSSHSPFLSMPEEVVSIILEALGSISGEQVQSQQTYEAPKVKLRAPSTWIKLGFPFIVGRVIGWCILGAMGLSRLIKKS